MTVSPEEFAAEQAHLTETYNTLLDIRKETAARIDARLGQALTERGSLLDELTLDFDNDTNLETYVEIEAVNKLMDSYNLAHDLDSARLTKAQTLLARPYFAKIRLQFKPDAEPTDVYLGVTGITNNQCKHFIVDWRSPIGEVYYNQESGPTSYKTEDGRTINANLLLRRQFDITGNVLNACFDTNVAIEDKLLLASLAKDRTGKLTDITATIQKEQNRVVRHEDVPVLLVNGVAGSGKTSILLQRIAYLFYSKRDTLDWRDVYLITPNEVFRSYIDAVLPSMGEHNPNIITWKDFLKSIGMKGRGTGAPVDPETLRLVDQRLADFYVEDRDFQDLRAGEEVVVPASQTRAIYRRLERFPQGRHRSTLVAEELHERVRARVLTRCKKEDVQDELYDLTEEEMLKVFGRTLVIESEEELSALAKQLLEYRYAPVHEAIEDGAWLRIDRVGMRLLNRTNLTAEEWLYVKLAFAGGANRAAKYVMIDEVQDYTEAQLMMLARYFCNAHFLLLGDPNQAIKAGTASFDEIRGVFARAFGSVNECRLNTSYRSTPPIAALFGSLVDPGDEMTVQSVQRESEEPVVQVLPDDAAWRAALRAAAAEALERRGGGSAAVLAADRTRIPALREALAGMRVAELSATDPLPKDCLVVADVAQVKGMEFDQVIVADAQTDTYGTDALSRHRLYTAISRATQRVTLLALGELTPLL